MIPGTCPTDWGVIITVIACLFAILGFMTCLFLYLANKIDSIGTKLELLRKDMHEEMRDFHGRLCAIEERNKPKTNP